MKSSFYFNADTVYKNIYSTKTNLSLYSSYYAEACNELAVPNLCVIAPRHIATCVRVEAVANRL